MSRRTEDPLTPLGRLKRKYRPAIYFESSVIVDYWSAEGLESHGDTAQPIPVGQEFDEAVRSLFRYHDRLRKMANVRREVCLGLSGLSVVTSPLAIIELFEWHAHSSFKQLASHAAGVVAIERMSKKEVGDFLAKVWKEGVEESRTHKQSYRVDKAPKAALWRECLLNTSYMKAHGLDGILDVEIRKFTIDAFRVGSVLSPLAFHQVGLADQLHLAVARHLRCR